MPSEPGEQEPARRDPVDGLPDRPDATGGSEASPDHDPATAADPSWNPTGVELARAVAASIGKVVGPAGSSTGKTRGRRRGDRRAGGDRTARSGARPDDRDPQMLDSTIDRLVNERGWKTDVAVAGAIARWDHIVGPDVAAHCRAERYADAELTVRADSTAWATQVRLLAPSLVRRLNEELGDDTVRRVVVHGPTAPSWQKGPRRVRDGRGPRDTYG
ncbi:DciA family protein [Actinopolymorpha pittospori]|uniref:Nucleic acid-binding Zn ribbon protein n=1 Tax=Actinopolymorpha pittospori TaxID=648752 RepID=A0A927MQG6_9ACTN|nr:putative nucleic acid-binding Zn ribbon protein [Actinopolymorpha pittospori]